MTDQNETTVQAQHTPDIIVTPVQLSKELDIRPQIVFSWVRANKFPHYECICGHTYMVRDELTDFLADREKRAKEKAEKIAAELAGKQNTETEATEEVA